jgi:hypothetical protein
VTAPVINPTAAAGAYTTQQQLTRAAVIAYLVALWSRLTSYRTPDATQFAGFAAAAVTGGQQRVAALTANQLTHLITAGGGTPGRLDLSGMNDLALRGVAAKDVYQRPFQQIWWDLSQGKPLDKAVSSAGSRLQSLVATDLQLAKTTTAQRMLSTAKGVTGYRRVLNGAYSCALCVLAATRTYHKADLMPLHSGCDCGIMPLRGGEQAPDVTADLHNLVADQLGEKYVDYSGNGYRDLVVTHNHGELGPVLGVRGQHWQGAPGG